MNSNPKHSSTSPRFAVIAMVFVSAIGLTNLTPAGAAFMIGQNFTGSNVNASGFIPPDTMGGVGPNHVVELINGRFRAYNRTGGLQANISLNQFWTSAGVTPVSFAFDPRVIYDQYTSRWFAASVDNARSANSYLLAVSNNSDPTAGWSGYRIDSDLDNSHWADYPMMGLNQGVVTIAANMFPLAGGSINTGAVVIDKASLIAGTPTITKFEDINANNTGFSLQPVWDLDNNPLPQKLLSSFNKASGSLKTSSITGTPPAPALNTAGGFITVMPRNSPPTIDQPGPKQNIDAGNSRFSGNVVQQHITGRPNPSLWGVHSVEINGRAAIEWYEIDSVTNTVLQSKTIADLSLAFNYPSIAVNDFGDVVIGFSGADSTSTFMSTYFAAGQTAAGVTTIGPVTLTKAGVADYQRLDSNSPPRNRWGDYSATVVDPTNQLHFWTFQEWASATDVWSIQITEIIVPEPTSVGWLGFVAMSLLLNRRRFRG